MRVSQTVSIAAPLEESWPLLSDVSVVAACIPGARLDEGEPTDGSHRGTLEVAFGPTTATFNGRATFTYDDASRSVAIEAVGSDTRGRTRAKAVIDVTILEAESSSTRLDIEGTIDVLGPLARFAEAGGAHLADELTRSFAACLASRIQNDSRAGAEAEAIRPLQIWWRRVRAWFRSKVVSRRR